MKKHKLIHSKKKRLNIMGVKLYKFGTLECVANPDGTITPLSDALEGWSYENEEQLIKSWVMSAEKLNKLGRKLIKVYEDDGLEVDITPKEEED
jgi:hypothetical protein